MTITLASLISRLQADAPAQDGVPTTAQYTQAVKDAVQDLSRRASVPRQATISVVNGTASYDLPTDFMKLIRLSQIGVPYREIAWDTYGFGGGTLVTSAGLVPFSDAYREQITVAGDQLIIYPTPTVSADRTLLYAAGDALNDAGDGYDTLSEQRASIALLYARAACLDRIASTPRMDAIRVTTGQDIAGGDVLDTTKRAEALRQTAQALRTEYLQAIASLNSANGRLG